MNEHTNEYGTTDEEWGVVTVSNSEFAYRKRPCAECPFRTDARIGRFPPEVFAASRATTVQPDYDTMNATFESYGALQGKFGCHMTAPSTGRTVATCAGFLAVAGEKNFSVRLSIIKGTLPASVLEPQPDWPELYDSYDDMCRANGYDPEQDPDAQA